LACSDLFDIKIGQEAADAKKKWLDNYPLKITDNEPFTDILKQLTVLVKEQLTASPESPVLTHKDVLTILDRGLSSSGWPEADKAIPHKDCSRSNDGMPHVGQRKKSNRIEASERNSGSSRLNASIQSDGVHSLESMINSLGLLTPGHSSHDGQIAVQSPTDHS